jgi:tRNA threonylcarbamoyladenosine biosynthesis protein TsaE
MEENTGACFVFWYTYKQIMVREIENEAAMKAFGRALGALLKGGEMIELIGDVGAGKTTLTKGIADGLAIDEDIQSPSFTISRVYDARDGITLAHYDFYRLHDPGIMADELHETLHNPKVVTIVEWAAIVSGVLPEDRLSIHIIPASETSRHVELKTTNSETERLLERLA